MVPPPLGLSLGDHREDCITASAGIGIAIAGPVPRRRRRDLVSGIGQVIGWAHEPPMGRAFRPSLDS